MLVIARKQGQRILIGDDVVLVVTGLSRSSVKIGIVAPRSCAIVRGEVRDAVAEANRAAARSRFDPALLVQPVRQPTGTDGRQSGDD